MTNQAENFAITIFNYGTKRGVDFTNITKEDMNDLVRNWYKSQVQLSNRLQEIPLSFWINKLGI